MVLQDGTPVAVRVTTGMTDGANTAVTAGLREGEAVVVGQTGGATAATAPTTRAATGTTSTNPLSGTTGVKPGG
jgi:hypothetical protein